MAGRQVTREQPGPISLSPLSRVFTANRTIAKLVSSLEAARAQIRLGEAAPGLETILAGVGRLLENWTAPTLQPVINATGTILHTNLGRAPLSRAAGEAMLGVSLGYSTLEYDLNKGGRGSRLVHAEALVQRRLCSWL
jgi:L-seryl-tRNA(Ser) seleniumtransferase